MQRLRCLVRQDPAVIALRQRIGNTPGCSQPDAICSEAGCGPGGGAGMWCCDTNEAFICPSAHNGNCASICLTMQEELTHALQACDRANDGNPIQCNGCDMRMNDCDHCCFEMQAKVSIVCPTPWCTWSEQQRTNYITTKITTVYPSCIRCLDPNGTGVIGIGMVGPGWWKKCIWGYCTCT